MSAIRPFSSSTVTIHETVRVPKKPVRNDIAASHKTVMFTEMSHDDEKMGDNALMGKDAGLDIEWEVYISNCAMIDS